MKKILISSALFTVLLAGCGSGTTEVKDTDNQLSKQEQSTTTEPTEKQEATEQEATEQEATEQEATKQQAIETESTQQQKTEVSEGESATETEVVETNTEDLTTAEEVNEVTQVNKEEEAAETAPSDQVTSNTEASEKETQQEQATAKQLTLYMSDENANYIEPYEEAFTGTEDELVPFIFEKVATFDTNLNNYKFESNGSTLVLDLDDTIFNVQGSAGGALYAGTLAQSYFDNLPKVNEVTFTYNGSYEEILDHLSVGVPYKRGEISVIAP